MANLTFIQYQIESRKTAMYPQDGISGISYTSLGLNGEAGEVAEKIKKIIRDHSGDLEDAITDQRDSVKKELGDVLWYISALAYEFGLSLEEVANANIKKLQSRKERNKIQGSGDDR
jgi:NTP pyrophosphatase (non-canonical NTP hydrolase)